MFPKNRILPMAVFVAVICVAILIAVKLPRQGTPSQNVGLELAHAQLQDPTTGCAKCHTQPIVANCTSCHPTPPTMINGISFPHHSPTPGDAPNTCQLSSCHDGGNDARYVVKPVADHTYCDNCHSLEHSLP